MAYRWRGQPWPTAQNPRTEDTQPPSGTCGNGHEMTAENVRAQTNGARIKWVCRECQRDRLRRGEQRKKLAKKERKA